MNATADIESASSRDGEVRAMLDDSVEAARQRVKDSRAAITAARKVYDDAIAALQAAEAENVNAIRALDEAFAAAESTA